MSQYAVWGHPIAQSKSPRIHQLFAMQTGKTIRYVAQLGSLEQFESELLAFFHDGASGANITAPFKERAFALADEYSERCLLAEACNTLKRLPDGRLYADNTDGVGLIADLQRLNWLVEDQRVLILGAGGATKGVLYPLLQAKQQLFIYNRTMDKAVDLSRKFANYGSISALNWQELENQTFDLVINATSLGLQGRCVELPTSICQQSRFYDMQYALEMDTPFLRYVRQQGASEFQDGLGMLVGQAGYAFELWEGVYPDMNTVLAQLKAEMCNLT